MNRTRLILLAAIVLIAAFVVLLATRSRAAPVLPGDPTHYSFFDAESCMRCHGPRTVYPQSENHPIGDDCMRCHARPKR